MHTANDVFSANSERSAGKTDVVSLAPLLAQICIQLQTEVHDTCAARVDDLAPTFCMLLRRLSNNMRFELKYAESSGSRTVCRSEHALQQCNSAKCPRPLRKLPETTVTM